MPSTRVRKEDAHIVSVYAKKVGTKFDCEISYDNGRFRGTGKDNYSSIKVDEMNLKQCDEALAYIAQRKAQHRALRDKYKNAMDMVNADPANLARAEELIGGPYRWHQTLDYFKAVSQRMVDYNQGFIDGLEALELMILARRIEAKKLAGYKRAYLPMPKWTYIPIPKFLY